MNRAAHMLARATARGGSYEVCVDGQTRTFTAAEIGHALGGFRPSPESEYQKLPEGAVRLLLVRYMQGAAGDSERLVWELVKAAAPSKKTAGAGPWVWVCAYTALARAAVAEYLSHRTCPVCEGAAAVMHGDLLKPCDECGATGRKRWSHGKRAKLAGVPLPAFRRCAAETAYQNMLRQCAEWEDMGLRRAMAKLAEVDNPVNS